MLCELKHFKSVSWLLITLLLWQYGGGLTYAQNRERAKVNPKAPAVTRVAAPPAAHTDLQFDALLAELKETLGAKEPVPQEGTTAISAAKAPVDLSKLDNLKARLEQENDKVQTYFSELETFIKQKGLSEEILNRHLEFVRDYEAKYTTLMTNLEGIELAQEAPIGFWAGAVHRLRQAVTGEVDREQVVTQTLSFLEANTPRPRKSHFDPHNLPHRTLKADKPIPPKLTPEEWRKAFSQESGETGSVSSLLSVATAEAAPTPAPTPADLAETIEVQFTPEIRNLAESLDHNPVQISNWVRNNIEFVPTWGSIQGAQLCMETKSCNAFDTASLLIALLRVAGIPARYQMGTIEVPIDQFMNWAGGFTNADAAASLFASGGVPSVVRRVDETGQVVSVKLEHVWVKAFVDYAPSGGAVNLQGDTWVELDAGFKQYEFAEGVNLEAVIPLNLQSFINQLTANATIDPSTGSVTNIDFPTLESFVQEAVEQRSNYLQTNVPAGATVGEVLGGQDISLQVLDTLSPTLAYRILSRTIELSDLPESLRHTALFVLESAPSSPDLTNIFRYTVSLPELARKNVLLLYTAASQADTQLLESLIDQSLPLPSSLQLVPQLYVGEDSAVEGAPLPAGSPVVFKIAFLSPTISTPIISNSMIAGETAAVGFDLQGIPRAYIEDLMQKSQSLGDRLQQEPLGNITNREFAEAVLSNSIIGWFGMTDFLNARTAQSADCVTVRYPSAGLFSIDLTVNSLFGVVLSITPQGLSMDIDRDVVVSVAKDGNDAKIARLSFLQGVYGSAMEAEWPRFSLSTPENPVHGAGTVQALLLANNQGIPIYTINASNAATILPLLRIDPSDLVDIQNATNANLEVIVPETAVDFQGQQVLGIVISDPRSGSASFLISGGANGAKLILLLTFVGIMMIGMFVPFIFPALVATVTGPQLLLFIYTVLPAFLILIGLHDGRDRNNDQPYIDHPLCDGNLDVLAGILGLIGLFVCPPCAFYVAFAAVFLTGLSNVLCSPPTPSP